MSRMNRAGVSLSALAIGWLACSVVSASEKAAVPVRVEKTEKGFRLLRDGKPFFVKGAGGSDYLDQLKAAGGNSVRTWGADKAGPILDEAEKLGLTVTVGIWLGHERHGFNYSDENAVAKQLETAIGYVKQFKDHPAVLMWGLGNEMEGYDAGDNPLIWKAVNEIAKQAKQIDPNHPTMTVISELGTKGDAKLRAIEKYCPDIDIVGINSYAGGVSIGGRYRKAGLAKPFIVTEFGPFGPWEVGKSSGGAPFEPTSTEKAEMYRSVYQASIVGQPDLCLGSYVFLWGNKQEATPTWFGMFLKDGTRMPTVDAMSELWSGKPPANRCPKIERLKGVSDLYQPGEKGSVTVATSDPDGDALTTRWVVMEEVTKRSQGGDQEAEAAAHPEAIVKSDNQTLEFVAPEKVGLYRIYAYVTDGKGNGATANAPFDVGKKRDPSVSLAPKAELPLVIYDDALTATYAASGWMGNQSALKMDARCTDSPHAGTYCLEVKYTAVDNWAGIAWQSPADNWGTKNGGWDLTAAKELSFWARGKEGGEVVKFEYGILGKDKKFWDTARGETLEVHLTKEWKQYSFSLVGKDLGRIITGFDFAVAGQEKPITFYLDDIVYK